MVAEGGRSFRPGRDLIDVTAFARGRGPGQAETSSRHRGSRASAQATVVRAGAGPWVSSVSPVGAGRGCAPPRDAFSNPYRSARRLSHKPLLSGPLDHPATPQNFLSCNRDHRRSCRRRGGCRTNPDRGEAVGREPAPYENGRGLPAPGSGPRDRHGVPVQLEKVVSGGDEAPFGANRTRKRSPRSARAS